ncbi:MAG: CarD family transcriptional regulator [Deltaproteobacteria bacterium]
MPKAEVCEFKVGDLAVYPAHGVALIGSIEKQKISGLNHSFYVLKILDSDATIMVPIKNANSVGMRKIMKKSMVPKVYSVLKSKKGVTIDSQTWNRRYRDYTEKIRTGCVIEVAKVLRDLSILKLDKELSFGERRMLDTAKNLLVKEISVAKNSKTDKVEQELGRLMKW